MAGYSRELLKGAADTLVLSTFADGEMYGYQVVKELDDQELLALEAVGKVIREPSSI